MKARGHHLFQRHPLFLVCFIFCSAVVLFYYNYPLEEKLPFLADDMVTKFVIDTIGCQIPAWDAWDDSVKHLFQKVPSPYKCPGQPSFLRTLPNGVVTVEDALLQFYYEVDLRNIGCEYQEITRNESVVDDDLDNRFSMGSLKNLTFNQPMDIDFIKTSCRFSTQKFEEFLPLTPLKVEVEKRCVDRNSQIKVPKPLNVIFLGLDSVSHLNFLRHFPKCQKYVSKFLNPITMNGYTKVGDNTFPNLVPLLTGYFYEHYYDEVNNKSMFFDDLDFSWKHFANLGYRTFLAEDAPSIATFNYFRNGFKIPPTDYYYRPFALALEKSEIRAKSKGECFGSKMEMEVLYDYLKSFTDTMGQSRPFYAFAFVARLTHDVFNFAGYADEPTYQLLKHLHESNILNNTMLVFYSDHGIRFGDIRKTRIGQYEERMPFMHLILPKWFLDEHKDISQNLHTNSYRLTTPFDVHATVRHLASLVAGETEFEWRLKPGLSLFEEVPPSRTCSDAAITPHWCTCQVSKPISKEAPIVRKASETVIKTINKRTNAYKSCATLFLNEIMDARVTGTGRKSLNNQMDDKMSSRNYLIVISVEPSKAIFESTVRCGTSPESSCEVLDDVSRINEYGKQSDCVSDAVIKKFCYCL
ncbi:hypothetical protein JTE90_012226 [Oedothorax gibbosus]|uniref:Uncharacterized protein n=1 Tax=Oedothorax gibbosus TaxID=931172 RepID=A0AAV6UWP8_9ARAC|nr:hypothetical protein JTE90_012226 [Oedothorax gibbosus]